MNRPSRCSGSMEQCLTLALLWVLYPTIWVRAGWWRWLQQVQWSGWPTQQQLTHSSHKTRIPLNGSPLLHQAPRVQWRPVQDSLSWLIKRIGVYWKTAGRPCSHVVPSLSWHMKIYQLMYRTSLLVLTLSQDIPVHIHFFKINFNVFFNTNTGFQTGVTPTYFSTEVCVCVFFFACYVLHLFRSRIK